MLVTACSLGGVLPNFLRLSQLSDPLEVALGRHEVRSESPDLGDRPERPVSPLLRSQLNGATYWAREALRRQAGAALGAASSKNFAACTRTHPQPKAVRLGATTIIGLVGALHDRTPASWKIGKLGIPNKARVP